MGAKKNVRRQSPARRGKGRHRAAPQHTGAYLWLGAGAVGLGIGAAALAGGTGVAHAETDTPSDSSSSVSSDNPGGNTPADKTVAPTGIGSPTQTLSTASLPSGHSDVVDESDEVNSVSAALASPDSKEPTPTTKMKVSASGGNLSARSLTGDSDSGGDDAGGAGGTAAPGVTPASTKSGTESDGAAQGFLGAPVDESDVALAHSRVVARVAETEQVAAVTSAPVSETLAAAAPTTVTVTINDAFLKPFLDADPTQRFAYTRQLLSLRGTTQTIVLRSDAEYQQFLTDMGRQTGYANFSRDSAGRLVYRNTASQDVLVVYGPRADSYAQGAVLVRAGRSATLPSGQLGSAAAAQLPGASDAISYIAIAFPGAPIPRSTGGTSAVITAASQVLNAVVTTIGQVTNSVLTTIGQLTSDVITAALPNAPFTTAGLFDTIWDRAAHSPDGMYIQRVKSTTDGKQRLIVYIAGTDPNNLVSVITNLPSYNGIVKPNQVSRLAAAVGADLSIPIMLVGHSQGGMDAQNIASQLSGVLNIQTVVTYGAPVVQYPPIIGRVYQTVHLRDAKDPIPKLSKVPEYVANLAAGRVYETTSRFSNQLPWWDVADLEVHKRKTTYEDIGNAFDRASGYDSFRNVRSQFYGKIIKTYP
jgi:hypothetical protein